MHLLKCLVRWGLNFKELKQDADVQGPRQIQNDHGQAKYTGLQMTTTACVKLFGLPWHGTAEAHEMRAFVSANKVRVRCSCDSPSS